MAKQPNQNPEISAEAVYSSKYDLWVTDLRLNQKAENILSRFKSDKSVEYVLPNGEKKKRFLMRQNFVGSFDNRIASERMLLCGLFDTENFDTRKRLIFAENHEQVQKQLSFLREIMRKFTGEHILLSRKLVAKIGA